MRVEERKVRSAAARWAWVLMEHRPEHTVCEQEELVRVLQANAAHVPPEPCSKLWAALERDDEDMAETARLVFEVLAQNWWSKPHRPTKDELELLRTVEQHAVHGESWNCSEGGHAESTIRSCVERGWVTREHADIELTVEGHGILGGDWGR